MRFRARSTLLSVALVASLAACGADAPAASPPPADGPATLTVMTQNLYLGADLDLLAAPGADVPTVAEQLWASMLASDFPARAKVIAATVQAADPDLLALQEVSLVGWGVFALGGLGVHEGHVKADNASVVLLADLLGSLQSNNIDPISVEADVNCLARFVCQNIPLSPDARPMFAFLSRRNGYFISPVSFPWQGISPTPAALMRTFLLSPSQNRNETLAKQVSITTALMQTASPVNRLDIFDVADSIKYDEIAGKVKFEAGRIDILSSAKLTPEALADCPDAVEFAQWPPHCIRGTVECQTVEGFRRLPFFNQITLFEPRYS